MIQEDTDDREPESFHREQYMEGLIDGLTLALAHPEKLEELRNFRNLVLFSKAKAAWLPTLVGLGILKDF